MKLIITEKKDRCAQRAARTYGKKTSLYRSMAISKCRKGKIWKEALESGVDESLLEQEVMLEYDALSELGNDTATLEEGSDHVCEACLYELLSCNECALEEAEYRGHKVTLNKPMRGDVKKYAVYVKDPKTGNIKKVNFGDKNMEIKRDNPERRKSFRARHKCNQKKDRTSPGFWSCKLWGKTPVSKIVGK